MGNCAVTQHAVTSWADDGEWELSPTAEDAGPATTGSRNDEHMAEVTIRITRRQLQELMEKRAGPKTRRAAVELLAEVMNAGQVYQQHCRAAVHWRPALQSIPETVESWH
jgi:ketosteroid isomerase-like protein